MSQIGPVIISRDMYLSHNGRFKVQKVKRPSEANRNDCEMQVKWYLKWYKVAQNHMKKETISGQLQDAESMPVRNVWSLWEVHRNYRRWRSRLDIDRIIRSIQ
jgi:hypothetical protein